MEKKIPIHVQLCDSSESSFEWLSKRCLHCCFLSLLPICVFCDRFDYEGLDPRAAFHLMRDLEGVISDKAFISQKFAVGDHIYSVEKAENFEYIDPVDGTVARNQVSMGKL